MPKAAKKEQALPKVSIIERRLQNPFGSPSESITLKEGQWALRWFSESVRTGRIYQAQQLGWEFVEVGDLRQSATDIGAIVVDGRVVRGEAGNREFLMKMRESDFQKVQRAKADKNLSDLQSTAKMKSKAANMAPNDEAAERIYNSRMEITTERVSYDLEGEGGPATE